MKTCVSTTYASPHSFSEAINSIDSFDLVETFIEKLKSIINEFDKYDYIDILFSNDLIDFKINNIKSLSDKIEDLSNGEEQAYFYYLGEIENTLGQCQSYIDTSSCEEKILNQTYISFPYYHPFTINEKWVSLANIEHVTSSICALNLNSKYIKTNIKDTTDFVKKATDIYGDLIFHPLLPDTISDLKFGNYTQYIDCFCHALNTLNQAYNIISNDADKNLDDLILISTVSANLGPRTLPCTRQAKNKVEYKFGDDEINCEYHLKLNFNDLGKKLPNKYYNRIYFGLKFNFKKRKKDIYVAHIGKHL
ncbi:hypothetical protein [Shewanella baltica]|uniref:hypothetical protein n=1 Tax=Shewanella baltica TaxID=62322 RepID=UPI00217E0829|nr:hypothetical protein [Shewanella baltica]MCS6192217.1 hypothetical protein [Shewanella baltica]